jgi:hypothetical protein
MYGTLEMKGEKENEPRKGKISQTKILEFPILSCGEAMSASSHSPVDHDDFLHILCFLPKLDTRYL